MMRNSLWVQILLRTTRTTTRKVQGQVLCKRSSAFINNNVMANVWCFADGATKAAIHSFTMASRHAYATTNIRLVEIVPPQVQTNLGGTETGEPCNAFCASVFQRFAAGELEIGYNRSEEWRQAPRQVHEQVSAGMAKMIKPPQFS